MKVTVYYVNNELFQAEVSETKLEILKRLEGSSRFFTLDHIVYINKDKIIGIEFEEIE